VEDVLVKVDKFIFPTDFIILDMEQDEDMPIILRRPFLTTSKALIDVEQGKLTLRLDDEKVVFKVFNSLKHPSNFDTYKYISTVNSFVPINSLFMQEIPIEDTVKKRNKTKKKNAIKAPEKEKNQPLKDTGQKAIHNKLVKVWKRKQEFNASALKNYKCDANSS